MDSWNRMPGIPMPAATGPDIVPRHLGSEGKGGETQMGGKWEIMYENEWHLL